MIETLKTAFVDGRLDQDELNDRLAQTLDARTYAELATLTADIPVGQTSSPPRPVDRRPARQVSVKRGLAAAGALFPPTIFVAGAFNGALAPVLFLALPLLFIELVVMLTVMNVTLASRRKDRSREPGAARAAVTSP